MLLHLKKLALQLKHSGRIIDSVVGFQGFTWARRNNTFTLDEPIKFFGEEEINLATKKIEKTVDHEQADRADLVERVHRIRVHASRIFCCGCLFNKEFAQC